MLQVASVDGRRRPQQEGAPLWVGLRLARTRTAVRVLEIELGAVDGELVPLRAAAAAAPAARVVLEVCGGSGGRGRTLGPGHPDARAWVGRTRGTAPYGVRWGVQGGLPVAGKRCVARTARQRCARLVAERAVVNIRQPIRALELAVDETCGERTRRTRTVVRGVTAGAYATSNAALATHPSCAAQSRRL